MTALLSFLRSLFASISMEQPKAEPSPSPAPAPAEGERIAAPLKAEEAHAIRTKLSILEKGLNFFMRLVTKKLTTLEEQEQQFKKSGETPPDALVATLSQTRKKLEEAQLMKATVTRLRQQPTLEGELVSLRTQALQSAARVTEDALMQAAGAAIHGGKQAVVDAAKDRLDSISARPPRLREAQADRATARARRKEKFLQAPPSDDTLAPPPASAGFTDTPERAVTAHAMPPLRAAPSPRAIPAARHTSVDAALATNTAALLTTLDRLQPVSSPTSHEPPPQVSQTGATAGSPLLDAAEAWLQGVIESSDGDLSDPRLSPTT